VRASQLLVAFGLLALACLLGSGQALACDKGTAARAEVTHASPGASPGAGTALGVEAQLVASFHAGHTRNHQGPHQPGHGSLDCCCMLCCSAAVPVALVAEAAPPHESPAAAVPPAGRATADAKAGGCLPFRPPRTT
jgi:hypothetical protein